MSADAPSILEVSLLAKPCKWCGLVKPATEFSIQYRNRNATESRRNVCKLCTSRHHEQTRPPRGDRRALRDQVLKEYGGRCSCCEEWRTEFLAIDHIGNWGHQERSVSSGSKLYRRLKREGFPKDRFRLLCHNCNMSIGIYGYCPHRPLLRFAPAWEISATAGKASTVSPISTIVPVALGNRHQKLLPSQVIEVKQRLALHESCAAIGRSLGVALSTIWDIKAGLTWKGVRPHHPEASVRGPHCQHV